MKYRGRLKSVEEFRNTVVRSREDGSILRLQDVAEVELGTMTYSFRSEMDLSLIHISDDGILRLTKEGEQGEFILKPVPNNLRNKEFCLLTNI